MPNADTEAFDEEVDEAEGAPPAKKRKSVRGKGRGGGNARSRGRRYVKVSAPDDAFEDNTSPVDVPAKELRPRRQIAVRDQENNDSEKSD